jgi:hypothetical protein
MIIAKIILSTALRKRARLLAAEFVFDGELYLLTQNVFAA